MQLFIQGEHIDPAVRASLLVLGQDPGSLEDLDTYTEELDRVCGASVYCRLYAKQLKKQIHLHCTRQHKARAQKKVADHSPVVVVSDSSDGDDDHIDSRYTALEKIRNKAHIKPLNKNDLTDSENDCGQNKSDTSDVDSVMEDYINNCGLGDKSESAEVASDNSFDSVDSDDEVFESESDESEYKDCDLDLSLSFIADIKKNRMKRKQSLIKIMPDGRLSLIELIQEQLEELNKMKLDLKAAVTEFTNMCTMFNQERTENVLQQLVTKVKILGRFVLGKLQLGYGKDLMEALNAKVRKLQKGNCKKISPCGYSICQRSVKPRWVRKSAETKPATWPSTSASFRVHPSVAECSASLLET